jgi:glucosamine--fructose-6-phosphate aminotransferase (isomerizing)
VTTIDRAAALRADVLDEPASLARLLDAWERDDGPSAALDAVLAGRPRAPLLLVGMGSSRFAAMTVAARLGAAGGSAQVEWASTPAPAPPDPGRPVIVISASGRTPETVAAAERHRGTSPVIAVTERPSSPLAAAADLVLPLLAGPESGGVACRTHLATLATLLLVAGRTGLGEVTPSRLRPAVDGLEDLIASAPAWLGPVADLVDGASTLQVIGDAGRPGAAEQAALMLREGPRLPATAWDAGDWAHVGIYTVLPGARVVLLSGTAYDRSIVDTVRSRSAEVVAIGPPVAGAAAVVPVPGAGDPLIRALVEVTAAELLAAEIWGRAEAEPVA